MRSEAQQDIRIHTQNCDLEHIADSFRGDTALSRMTIVVLMYFGISICVQVGSSDFNNSFRSEYLLRTIDVWNGAIKSSALLFPRKVVSSQSKLVSEGSNRVCTLFFCS
eukprot:765036-Hanusia_phi.AAC.1